MTKNEILDEIKNYAKENHVPILQDETLELIEVLLDIKRPKSILEIGTAIGYSAIKFSKYLNGKDAKITSIEKSKEMYKIALENISKVELQDKIEVINADAVEYLETLDERTNTYDVIFIDAAKGQYVNFLNNAIRLSNTGTVIIADNVLFKGRVLSDYNEHKYRTATNRLREYLKIISEDKRLHSKILDIGDGVAISVVCK